MSTSPLQIPSVALVRHGQTDWNKERSFQGSSEVSLNATGIEQARAAAEALRTDAASRWGSPWDVILTSPQLRARETAEIIAEHLGLEAPRVVAGLKERSYGPYEGRAYGDLDKETFTYLFPAHLPNVEEIEARGKELGILEGVESSKDAGHRAVTALAEALQGNPGQRVIAVSHGSTTRCLLNTLDEWNISNPGLSNCDIRYLTPAQEAHLHHFRNALP